MSIFSEARGCLQNVVKPEYGLYPTIVIQQQKEYIKTFKKTICKQLKLQNLRLNVYISWMN